MPPSARAPVGEAATLWAVAVDALAAKKYDDAKKAASESLERCNKSGAKTGEACATMVLALADLAKAGGKGAELVSLFKELGVTWSEAACMFAAAEAGLQAGSGDKWATAASACVSLKGKMASALGLLAAAGVTWGPLGEAVTVDALHITRRLSDAEVQAAISAPSKKSGNDKASALLKASAAHLQKEEIEEAKNTATEALGLFRQSGDTVMEATALRIVAKAHVAGLAYADALQAANAALKIFKQLGHRKGEASALSMAATVSTAKLNAADGAFKATEAAKMFRQLGDRIGEGAALEIQAKCYCIQSDFKKGLAAGQEAVVLAQELDDPLQEATRMCIVSEAQTGCNATAEALVTASEALDRFASRDADSSAALTAIAKAYVSKGELEEAVNAIKKEADRLQQKGHTKQQAAMLCQASELAISNKDHDLGLAPIMQALSIYKSLGDKKGEATALNALAQIKLEQGETGDALRSAETASVIFKELGKAGFDGYIASLDCVIKATASMSSAEEALNFAAGMLKSFSKEREKRGEAVMLMAIASLQVEEKDIDGALSTLNQVPALFAAVGDKNGEANAWTKMAQVHFARSEPGLALRAAEEALAAFSKVGDKSGKARAAMLVADAHFSLAPYGEGNGRDACKAAQEAMSAYESMGNKAMQALATQVLANAQLMSQSYEDAKRNAAKAEELFQEVSDRHGQAGSLLIIAGAHLGAGEFPEARDRAKEAREYFRSMRDDSGEDGVEDFLADLKDYEAGKRKKGDFMGFSMDVGAPRQENKPRRRRTDDHKFDASKTDVEMMTVGDKNDRITIQFFDRFESRSARAPPAGGGGGKKSKDEDKGPEKTQVLYSVRWIKSGASGDRLAHKSDNLADKRVSMSLDMGQPKDGFGRTGPTNRTLLAAA